MREEIVAAAVAAVARANRRGRARERRRRWGVEAVEARGHGQPRGGGGGARTWRLWSLARPLMAVSCGRFGGEEAGRKKVRRVHAAAARRWLAGGVGSGEGERERERGRGRYGPSGPRRGAGGAVEGEREEWAGLDSAQKS